MKTILNAVLITALSACNALAAENAANGVTDAQREKVRAQVKSLQTQKMQDVESANKSVKSDAMRKGKTVDDRIKGQHAEIDAAADNYLTRMGPEGVRRAAEVRKERVSRQGQDEKSDIANEARRKAAGQRAAASKASQGVQESVEGLKSQLSAPGEYGLKPKGSSLYVRNYGK
jgi:hypothetical protein